MKKVYDKVFQAYFLQPETSLEAIEQFEEFLLNDMWHAINSEFKTEKDFVNYLKGHFDICKKQIKELK